MAQLKMSWTDSWPVFFSLPRVVFFSKSTSELLLEGSMLLDGSIFEVNDSHSVDGFRHLKAIQQTVHP